jgi:hypothetical protein
MARSMGASVEHRELRTSHSPFLSQPEEVVQILVDAVGAFIGNKVEGKPRNGNLKAITVPEVILSAPYTWFRFGIPLALGRMIGRGIVIHAWLKSLWNA